MKDLTVIILASGMDNQMSSDIPKVCHKIGDKTIIERIVTTAKELEPGNIIIIVSKDNIEYIRKVLIDETSIRLKIQHRQLGTANAVLSSYPCMKDDKNLLVLLGDVPMVKPRTLFKVCNTKYDVVIIGFKTPDLSKPYGRIVINNNRVISIVEFSNATTREKNIKLCNSGMIWIKKDYIHLLHQIKNDNIKKEYYLTDVIAIMSSYGLHIGFLEAKYAECMSVDTPEDLISINKIYYK